MDTANRRAIELVDEAIDFGTELRIDSEEYASGARVLDCGVTTPGGIEAGLLAAEIAASGVAAVGTALDETLAVECTTDHLDAVASHQQRRTIDCNGGSLRVSGPGTEDGGDMGVVVVEHDERPSESDLQALASATNIAESGLVAVVVPPETVAGQVLQASTHVGGIGERLDDSDAVVSVATHAPLAGDGRGHVLTDRDIEADAVGADGDLPVPATVTVETVGGARTTVETGDRE
jgi:methenyltetrahydromethanopterin cyclohydrolase